MNNLYIVLLLMLSSIANHAFGQPPKQVTIESKFVEVQQNNLDDLGFEFGFGPSIGTFTNQTGSKPVVGINAFGGINLPINRIVEISSHINFIQFGRKIDYGNSSSQIKITNLGVDVGLKVNVVPELVVRPYIIGGADIGINITGRAKNIYNGVKTTDRFQINTDYENRFFAGLFGGVGVTARTDVGDLSLQFTVLGGVTEFFKDPNDQVDRSVPLLFNIPLIYQFFGKREKTRERNNLILLVTPRIIDGAED